MGHAGDDLRSRLRRWKGWGLDLFAIVWALLLMTRLDGFRIAMIDELAKIRTSRWYSVTEAV